MCKEDVRLARAANPNQAFQGSPTAGPVKIFTADAERYALTCHIATPGLVQGDIVCQLAARIGGQYYPLLSLANDHPGGTVSLLDVGALILGEIWWISTGTVTPTSVYISDSGWDRSQEEI